jgi:hypothetical protein
MKKLIFLLALVSATASMAQLPIVPPREFTVTLSESLITLKRGESKMVTVTIARSKSFSKAEAVWGVSSSLPKGVAIQYSPASGLSESSVATITAGPETPAGSYSLILNATLHYKTKGSVVTLVVADSDVAAN